MLAPRLTALAVVMLAALALPASTMAAIPISVFVITGDACVSGTGPRNAEVIATLRTPGGHIRGRFVTESDDFGGWAGCFPASINGADRLRVVAGNQDRTIVVPRVEPEVDRVQDLIEGFAPPNSPVQIGISHRKTLKESQDFFFETTADGSGNYSYDTTGEVNLRGGDFVTVITDNGNDLFGAIVLAPHINVLHANNVAYGTANNGTDLVLELFDEHGALKADVTAGASPLFFGISLFQVSLFDDDGAAVYPVGGDRLTATLADDADIEIPRSYLTGAPSTDVVSGRCMPNASYALRARFETFYGKTNSTGRFTRDVGSRMNLRRGDDLLLSCLYPTGDTWTRTGVAL